MIASEGWATFSNSESGLRVSPRRRDAWATQEFDSARDVTALARELEHRLTAAQARASADDTTDPTPPTLHSAPDDAIVPPADSIPPAQATSDEAIVPPADPTSLTLHAASDEEAIAPPADLTSPTLRAVWDEAIATLSDPAPPAPTDDREEREVSDASVRAAAPTPLPSVVVDDDAYFHPGGDIRAFGDATLQGWRIEPTLQLRRVRERNQSSWVVLGLVAVVAPLVLLAFAVAIRHFTPAPTAPRTARLHAPDWTRSPLAENAVAGPQPRPARSATIAPARGTKSTPATRRTTRRTR